LKAGVSALDYWDMTPREVYAAIRSANWRIKYEHDERAWQAWHTAALMRQKRLPPLKQLIDPPMTHPLSEDEAKEHKEFHKKAINALPERFKNNLQSER
jgi:hypothetical protein